MVNAQIELRHGLILGGGKGSLCDVNYIQKGFGFEKATDVKITSASSSYKYNASAGYRFRMENRNKNKLFYDLDLSFAIKGGNYNMEGTFVDENGDIWTFQDMPSSFSFIGFSIGFSAGYKIYKGLYAGAGIEPTCYFHTFQRFIKIFDAPPVGKLGYDFKYFDIAAVYRNGLFNALKSDHFSKGRINDWQIQLFIPF
jgi:hypothetical protein